MELYAHNVSDLASNLAGHIASFFHSLGKTQHKSQNSLNEPQTILIHVSALSLLIHDALAFSGPLARG